MKTHLIGQGKKSIGGFSAMELLIVVAIIAIISAISVPPILRTLAGFKVRGAASNLESLIQDTRMRSVRDDAVYTLYPVTVPGGTIGYCVFIVPNAAINPPTPAPDTSGCVGYKAQDVISNETVFLPPTGVQIIAEANAPAVVPTPTGANAYTQNDGTVIPVAYNARGLPCQVNVANGACATLVGAPPGPVGFVYYLSMTANGSTIYRAVSVTPAGRVKLWSYSKGAWQ